MFQKDVAKELGVNQWTLIGWEKDQKVPYARYFPAIVSFIGYDPLPPPTTTGQKLRRDRWLLGLTSQAMAKRLGIDQSTLLRRERE